METDADRKVLIVGYDEEWRIQLGNSLLQAGYGVLPAQNGSEAMSRAEDPKLGLMMIGEDLAGENGRMLTRFLHKNHPGVPILFCTNRDRPDAEVLNLADEGIDQCVPKDRLEELIVRAGQFAC